MAEQARDIPVRQLQVDLSAGFSRHWHGGDAYRSHLFNSLSMLFPLGEQNFIDVLRLFIPMLEARDAQRLLADVRAFIGQEATHRRLHALYNEQLGAQGYVSKIEHLLAWRIRNSLRFSPLSRLAIVAAFEHFTAVLGDGMLRKPGWSDVMQEPLKAVWRWHAAEETEHKAVAFDVYREAGGGYWRRVGWFAYANLIFMLDTTFQSLCMLHCDRVMLRPSTWRSAVAMWWGRDGLVWHLAPRLLRYFSPWFHPDEVDNHALVARWRSENAELYRTITAPEVQDGRPVAASGMEA